MSTLLSLRNFVWGSSASAKPATNGLWTTWRDGFRAALEASARARSRQALLELSHRYSDTDPELAKELRTAAGE